MEIAIENASREARERIIKDVKYYGITLEWSVREVVTKLEELENERKGKRRK